MPGRAKSIAILCFTVLLALYVVGIVSHGVLRHIVQTLPLWVPILLGLQRRELAKWAALPCFLFWAIIMSFIWLFLLGWAQIVRGHFSPVEIAMTIVIGAASVLGIAQCLAWKTSVRFWTATATFVLFAALQLAAFRVSLLPWIATH